MTQYELNSCSVLLIIWDIVNMALVGLLNMITRPPLLALICNPKHCIIGQFDIL